MPIKLDPYVRAVSGPTGRNLRSGSSTSLDCVSSAYIISCRIMFWSPIFLAVVVVAKKNLGPYSHHQWVWLSSTWNMYGVSLPWDWGKKTSPLPATSFCESIPRARHDRAKRPARASAMSSPRARTARRRSNQPKIICRVPIPIHARAGQERGRYVHSISPACVRIDHLDRRQKIRPMISWHPSSLPALLSFVQTEKKDVVSDRNRI